MSAAVPAESEVDDAIRRLDAVLLPLDPLVVAFSGGVDSSALLALALRRPGARVVAVTGVSPSLSRHALDQAVRVARALAARHLLLGTAEIENEDYARNPVDRCFFCKDELYSRLRATLGGSWPEIADGTNADDLGDFRPGREAARRLGVRSPFVQAGVGKEIIRAISRRLGLETADAPASPCLASRLPAHTRVTPEALARIERAEDGLRGLGFREFRVRDFGACARIEIAAAEIRRLDEPAIRAAVQAAVRAAGFPDAAVDDRPLVSGRLVREAT